MLHRRTWKLLFVGRIAQIKGPDLLIEALQYLDPREVGKIELRVVGPDFDGLMNTLVQKAADCSPTNVKFLGPLWGASKEREMADCDLIVIPSRSEGFSVALLESLAAARPIVATKTAAQALQVPLASVKVVAPEPRSIADGIESVLSDYEEYRRRAHETSISVFEDYSWASVRRRYLRELYLPYVIEGDTRSRR